MEPVPIGVAGEIYLGGAGLARGYLQCADLTAARFVPNPFARCPGERLYRTGDQARYLPDGSIVYLGRDDRQVKLRGYRIELDEIETVLCQHEAIDRAVVTIRETAGDRRLVAYVVPRRQTLAVNDIRNYLKQRLPSYMVPPAIQLIESMPLTPNDKVDHRALPEPTMGIGAEREFVAPANESERTLAGIWIQLLGVEQPGTSDNFFELGGHSLLAVRLISRIREVFQLELTIGEVFMHPTIASLAAHIESLTLKGVTVSGQTIKRVSRQAYRKTLSVVTN
jgi:acyl carrier protein